MAVNGEGEVVFCPGCPAQGDFLGPVEVEDASISFTDMTSYKNSNFNTTVVFEDQDGLQSVRSTTRLDNKALREQYGVPMTVNNGGYISYFDRYKQGVLKRLGPAKEAIVDRVERCSSAEGRKKCPAINNDIVGKLLQNALVETME